MYNKDEVFQYVKKVALSSKDQVLDGRNPKAPCISWTEYPSDYEGFTDDKYGTGIVCNHIKELDKHLVVIDLDNPKSKEDIPLKYMKQLLIETIKDTYTVSTPSGGLHIYLLSNTKPQAKQPRCNIDYQTNTGEGNGKYVVSNFIYDNHGNKKTYDKLKESSDNILVLNNTDKLLNNLIKALEEGGYLNTPVNDYMDSISVIIQKNIRKGKRNDLVMALSGYLRKNGFPLESTIQIVTEAFKDDEELDHRINTVNRTYNQEISNITGWNELKKYLSPFDAQELENLVSGNNLTLKDKIISILSKNGEPGNKLLADFINSELVLYEDSKLRKYYERKEDGSIIEIDENRIIKFTNEVFGDNQISRNKCRNILKYVTKQISRNYNLIDFKNGILNTETREFRTNKKSINEIPKLYLPFNYSEDSEPGRIEELIEEILYTHEYPDNKDLWLRAVGHAFMATNRIGKMVMVQGESGTGKSTLTTILKRIFSNSYSEIKTQDIVKDERFTLYPLIGKAINIDDDISNGMLRGIGNLNTICTGNGLQVEVKGENKAIQADNQEIPRLFANGNTLPPVVGTGFERRLLLIHADNKIPYNDKDEYLQSDIISGKYDNNGIEWLVYHSINLYLDKQHEPLTSEAHERKMIEEYEFKAYPLKKAIETIFVESWEDNSFITKKEVYKYLKLWCKWAFKAGKISKEHLKPSKRSLIRAMDDAGFTDRRVRIADQQVWAYEDIKIKPEWENMLIPSKPVETQSCLTEMATA